MRPAMSVAFLLFLLLLAGTAQGIRLGGDTAGASQKKVQEENGRVIGGEGPVGGTDLCSDGGRCSGRTRKLLMEATATHKSKRSEAVEVDGSRRPRPKEEVAGIPVQPSVSEHKKSAPGTYPDLLDIAGMDYSPAVKKPPIHN